MLEHYRHYSIRAFSIQLRRPLPSYKPLGYNFTHRPVNRVPTGYNFTHRPVNRVPTGYNFTHSPVNRVPKGYNFTHSPVNRVPISIMEQCLSSN